MNKLLIPGILGCVGLIILLAGVIALTLFNGIIEKAIKKQLPIEPGSDAYKRFEVIKSPVFMDFYIYHAQNTSCGTDFANMQLVVKGPYVFEEKRFKDNIQYTNDSEFVIYNERRSFTFREDLSNGLLLNDSVSVINFPLLGLIHNVGYYSLFQLESQIIKNRNDPTTYQRLKNELQLFINTTAGQIFFDGIPYGLLDGTRFGIFFGSEGTDNNKTEKESWKVYSGIKSMDNYLEIVEYAGFKTIKGFPRSRDLWHDDLYNSSCNVLRGTDGTQFSPSLKKEDRVYAFEPQLCRVVYLDYETETKVKDIKTYRYRIPKDYFDNSRDNENSRCYCNEPANNFEECSVSGVLDISHCDRQSSGAPIVMSPPHFLYGGGHFNRLVGLEYSEQTVNVQKYGTYLDIEPMTGVVLSAGRKIQVNVRLHSSAALPELNDLKEKIVVPVIWINEHGEASDEDIQDFKDQVLSKIKLGMGLIITAIVIGGVLILVAIGLYIYKSRESSFVDTYRK